MARCIGQINGLLRVGFLTDPADKPEEIGEIPTYWPEKLVAAMIVQTAQEQFKVHRVSF